MEDRLQVGDLVLRGLRKAQLMPEPGKFKFIVTVNSDFVVLATRIPRFANIIAENLSTIDGQIVYWLARLLARPKGIAFEKISGSSFCNDLIRYAAKEKLRVFILGASSSVNAAAVDVCRRRYRVDAQGMSPPFSKYPMSPEWSKEILDAIASHRPSILLVGLGAPKQEFWIEDHIDSLKASGVCVAIGCGGALEFIATTKPRAPEWIQRAGLEGVFRFLMEPSWFRLHRLFRSFLVFPIILGRTEWKWKSGGRSS